MTDILYWLLIHQSKANLGEKHFSFGEITHLQDPKIRKIPVWGLYGNREFCIPFWSMIHFALKFKSDTMVSFRNRILISVACK